VPGLSPGEFASLVERLGPFEPNPVIAIAWSGGGDSTALLLLARDWARMRGGRAVALHVDHGLRAESAAEAAMLAARAKEWGIDFVALHWDGPKPRTGILEAAREARYALLEAECARRAILHLLVAHNADDQAETIALRAERRSGALGLAGMSAIVERAQIRLLRPVLDASHETLLATCRAYGAAWIEDPSNANPATARGRLRESALPKPDPQAANARRERERDLAHRLALSVAVAPEGFARLNLAALGDGELAVEALGRIARAIGGGEYTPRRVRATGVFAALMRGRAATLGRCRFAPARDGRIVVAREAAPAPPEIPIPPGEIVAWDGRFALQLHDGPSGLTVGALGEDGWAALPQPERAAARLRIPLIARAVLPALRDLDGVLAVPHLLYGRNAQALDTLAKLDVRFRPRLPMAPAEFV
jgi:tRNA(Ile)-lysidine synthase